MRSLSPLSTLLLILISRQYVVAFVASIVAPFTKTRISSFVSTENTALFAKELTDRQLQFWEDVEDGLDEIAQFWEKKGQSIDRIRLFGQRYAYVLLIIFDTAFVFSYLTVASSIVSTVPAERFHLPEAMLQGTNRRRNM
jgi:hypothetical protein